MIELKVLETKTFMAGREQCEGVRGMDGGAEEVGGELRKKDMRKKY